MSTRGNDLTHSVKFVLLVLPLRHALHDDAPELGEIEPVEQGVHSVLLIELEYVPGSHAVQESAVDEYVPGPHALHDVLPFTATEPASQGGQTDIPSVSVNLPASQSMQGTQENGEYLPAGHLIHELAPVYVFVTYPGLQVKQS